MEEVKKFVQDFLLAEATAHTASLKSDEKDYIKKYDIMHSFVDNSLYGSFGIIRNQNKDDSFFKDYANFPPCVPRHFYKLSKYINEIYREIWVAYVSHSNPDEDWFSMSNLLVVAQINDGLKIIQRFLYADDEYEEDVYSWENMHGDYRLHFPEIGEFIETGRYLEPVDEDEAMEFYTREC